MAVEFWTRRQPVTSYPSKGKGRNNPFSFENFKTFVGGLSLTVAFAFGTRVILCLSPSQSPSHVGNAHFLMRFLIHNYFSNDKTDRFLNSENSEILSKTASHKNEAHDGSGHDSKAHPLSLITAHC
jgi:hypothetical protein